MLSGLTAILEASILLEQLTEVLRTNILTVASLPSFLPLPKAKTCQVSKSGRRPV